MSNAIAIAAVTETLSRVVEAAAKRAVSGAEVTNDSPESPPSTSPTRVSLYLYRVSENPHLRADDLPTRNSGGTVLKKPQIALDLDYLVSYYGLSTDLERERMLGSVASTLHSRPLLSADAVQAAIDSQLVGDPGHFLGGSDLPQAAEPVRVTPIDLDLEEMSKIWSVFFQEPYTLSTAYRASVVLIEVDETTREGLPVEAREVRAVPVGPPFISAVAPAAVPYSAGAALLTLSGTALASDNVTVNVGGVTSPPQLVTTSRIVVPVPPTLPAGVHVVYVAHMVDWGSPSAPDLRPIIESNRVPFAFQPEISASPAAVVVPGPLAVSVNPEIQADQKLRLLLNEVADTATGPPRSFEAEQFAAAVGHDVAFDLTGAPTGTYWVRVAVDGVTSPLAFDGIAFTGPQVVVT